MAVRENFHDATFCLAPASLDESLPTAARLGELGQQPGRREATCGKRGTTDLTPITDATTRPAAGEATRPPKHQGRKRKEINRQFTPATPQNFPSVWLPLPANAHPPGGPPCFKPFWLPRALSCPLGGGRRKVQEAVSGRGCRAAFPGASQRGRLPAPSAQAILGKGRRGFDWPWVSGTGPPPAVELGPLLTSEHGFFFISICFPCDGSPSQGGLGEISLTGRNPSQRGCKTDGRAHGSVGRDGSREKGGGTGLHPSFQAPTDPFSPSSRKIPATPTTAENKTGSEVWGRDDALPDPSYFEHGLIYSAAGFEAIERGADPKVQPSWAPIPFCGEATHRTQLQLFDGRVGRATLSHKNKNQIDPIPSSRGPLCTQRSRPGPDRPGYRGTAPPFRRTPPPIRTTDRRCQTQRGESVSGQDLPLAALVGWLDRSLEE